jgi:CubicO group peptidase (beta-lactamase class C family)
MMRFRIAGLLLLLLFFSVSCTYVRRVLLYWTADIDDNRFFPDREVAAGDYQPWPVSRDVNMTSMSNDESMEFVNYGTVAYLVIQHDSIIHEEYWDGYNPYSESNSFSMAKSFLSMMVGCAIEEGKIKSVDQKVGDFIPEYNVGDNTKITIRHLLTMSSGINWTERYKNPFGITARAYYGTNLSKMVLNRRLKEEPGVTFRYLSGTSQLLAIVIERATGQKVSDYFSEKIWKPIGARNAAKWSLDRKDGLEKAFCCFNSNAQDFARIGQLMLDKGNWKGKQLIPESWVEESTKPASELKLPDGTPVNFYGYQWWMKDHKGHHVIAARGLFGQYIFIIPDKDAVIVRLGNRCRYKSAAYPSDIDLWLDVALELLK